MLRRSSLDVLRVSLLAAIGLSGCSETVSHSGDAGSSSDSSTGAAASGATSTTGGSASSSGAGNGGAPGAGGASSAGGANSAGGASGVGGTPGAGGASSAGGAPGAGGASGVGGALGAGGAPGAGGGPVNGCTGAIPVLDPNGADTGFVKCSDGTVQRDKPLACDPTAGAPACTGTEESIQCLSDADCTALPNGKCASYPGYGGWGAPKTICGCAYTCSTDNECAAGQVCVCSGVVENHFAPWAACAPAACASGADCASGECGVTFVGTGCGFGAPALACRSATDECRFDSACAPDVFPYETCSIDKSAPSIWQCVPLANCGIGRPLLVDGRARTARSAARPDWAVSDQKVDRGSIDARARAALVAHWLDVAALEHASIASFARFTLHLLALGAPPSLVAEAQRAGIDEIEHARLAYGLASAYAGETLGPGPLNLKGVDFSADRRDVLRALIEEACVGETLAVAEARAIAGYVCDPTLRIQHDRIADDEQRHAELGWRTLAWLLDSEIEGEADFARQCFESAMAAARRPPSHVPLPLPEHGLLAEHTLAAIRDQALREVVEPCAAALFAGRPPERELFKAVLDTV